MKKTRYVISDPNMGIFLGTYNGYDLGREDDSRIYACFAANNPFALTTCPSFKTERAANHFIKDMFPTRKQKELITKAIECDSEFPTVVNLIKNGLSEDTFDMIDGLVGIEVSDTIH